MKKTSVQLLEPRVLFNSTSGDFNGDGVDDLVISVQNEALAGSGGTPNAIIDAGAVNVIYGTRQGLRSAGNQFWHQDRPGVKGKAAAFDYFGQATAAGDFDKDGFDDLAVCAQQTIDGKDNAGVVLILYGSRKGLSTDRQQLLSKDTTGINGTVRAKEYFGSTLAAGDFDGDGVDDLAASATGEKVNGLKNAGAIHILFGSNEGLTGQRDQIWTQDSDGIVGNAEQSDFFGAVLTAGDFNNDRRDDLAVGIPDEDVGEIEDAGAMQVIFGGKSGLRAKGNVLLNQTSDGVDESPEQFDLFGQTLAAGDFDGDGFDDIALAATGEIAQVGADFQYGKVHLFYGAETGFFGRTDSLTRLDFLALNDDTETIGFALAAADFNADGRADLAVSADFDEAGTKDGAGRVVVAYGTSEGPDATNSQPWDQQDVDLDDPEISDRFGRRLVTGDFDGDGRDDLGIAVPEEDLGLIPIQDTGGMQVLYGFHSGLLGADSQFWTQNSDGILDESEVGDFLGL